ncbi:MAG: hypothetical protein ACRC28_02825 [Clostridium sp.]|uniref:hypothetical protein n=1 Tax=Clostridium sp. TaxID=1506 RepID=UPI003F2D7913
MLLKIILSLISLAIFLITFKFDLQIRKIKLDPTKKLIYSHSPIISGMPKVVVSFLSLLTILNLFTDNYTTIRALLSMWWIILVPSLIKLMRDNYIVLGENSIEINLKDTVLFNDIKEVSYTNLTTETSPNTKIKIDLHLINDTSKSITFRDEYEASNLYKKLQALSN